MTETDQKEAAPAALFTTKDRCDRCGAQAKMLSLMVTGILLFCAHHGREYGPALAAAGAANEWEA